MIKKVDKNVERKIRHARLRKKISGTPERPRLCVFKSNKHIYTQIIDDVNGVTLAAASTVEADVKAQCDEKSPQEVSKIVGIEVAKRAISKDIKEIVFDRGGYRYHGNVKAVAEGAREGGLVF